MKNVILTSTKPTQITAITPDWPAPKHIHSGTTTRQGGVSCHPFDELNLAQHVGDNPAFVTQNRQHLSANWDLPNTPYWLQQTHSTKVIKIDAAQTQRDADASFTDQANQVLAVLTADCLPILVCQQDGKAIAAIHAGWRGLAQGIIENTLNLFRGDVWVWLGPAIGPRAFEVGKDVRDIFCHNDPKADEAFQPHGSQYLANLYQLAQQRLHRLGVKVNAIFGGEYCTWQDSTRFYSYRREGQCGRMASLIWMLDS